MRRRIGRKEGEEEGKLANALEAKATNPEFEQNAYTFEDSSWKLYLPEHLIFVMAFKFLINRHDNQKWDSKERLL